MKITFIIGLFFCSTLAFAQVKGLTEDGKEVVLFDNGTWRFVNESDAKSLETIITNNIPFQKSSDASFLMRSKRMNMGVYFNPNKWKVSPYAASPYTEYLFSKTSGDDQLVAFLITEKIQIPTLKNLKDIIIINIQKNADFFRLKDSEYRTVNGLKFWTARNYAPPWPIPRVCANGCSAITSAPSSAKPNAVCCCASTLIWSAPCRPRCVMRRRACVGASVEVGTMWVRGGDE